MHSVRIELAKTVGTRITYQATGDAGIVIPYIPSDFTGTVAGNWHYSICTIEGALLYYGSFIHIS